MVSIIPSSPTDEVVSIERRPDGVLVTVRVTQPVKNSITFPLAMRAKARALVAVGIADVTVDKVTSFDIRKFTEVRGSRTVSTGKVSRVREYDVLVNQKER